MPSDPTHDASQAKIQADRIAWGIIVLAAMGAAVYMVETAHPYFAMAFLVISGSVSVKP